ncbi:MAG TPA: hypothetical protein VFK96_09250 [Gammaproteobacteria bacterium]|nr:hypothetical protein [Gammaproteobacteria bacterium]
MIAVSLAKQQNEGFGSSFDYMIAQYIANDVVGIDRQSTGRTEQPLNQEVGLQPETFSFSRALLFADKISLPRGSYADNLYVEIVRSSGQACYDLDLAKAADASLAIVVMNSAMSNCGHYGWHYTRQLIEYLRTTSLIAKDVRLAWVLSLIGRVDDSY